MLRNFLWTLRREIIISVFPARLEYAIPLTGIDFPYIVNKKIEYEIVGNELILRVQKNIPPVE